MELSKSEMLTLLNYQTIEIRRFFSVTKLKGLDLQSRLLTRIYLTSFELEWEESFANLGLAICETVLDGNAFGAAGVKLPETGSHNCRLVKKTTLLKI